MEGCELIFMNIAREGGPIYKQFIPMEIWMYAQLKASMKNTNRLKSGECTGLASSVIPAIRVHCPSNPTLCNNNIGRLTPQHGLQTELLPRHSASLRLCAYIPHSHPLNLTLSTVTPPRRLGTHPHYPLPILPFSHQHPPLRRRPNRRPPHNPLRRHPRPTTPSYLLPHRNPTLVVLHRLGHLLSRQGLRRTGTMHHLLEG